MISKAVPSYGETVSFVNKTMNGYRSLLALCYGIYGKFWPCECITANEDILLCCLISDPVRLHTSFLIGLKLSEIQSAEINTLPDCCENCVAFHAASITD